MTDKITFTVPGVPIPQGSANWVVSKTTGKVIPIVSKKLKPWRREIAWIAKDAMGGQFFVGGVSMTLVFTFERPKCHYRTGKFSHLLRDDAPDRHLQKPDGDKLERAVLDALTGVAYSDDSEVDVVGKQKRWGQRGGFAGLECTMRGVCYGTVQEKAQEET